MSVFVLARMDFAPGAVDGQSRARRNDRDRERLSHVGAPID